MLARVAAFVLLAALTAAEPAAAFQERHDHWHVIGSSSACAAFNRPLEEWNASPYASVSLRQRRGQPAKLQVFAWPGVFKAGERVEIRVGPNLGTVMTGDAADTYLVEAKEPLPKELIAEMKNDRVLRVRLFTDTESRIGVRFRSDRKYSEIARHLRAPIAGLMLQTAGDRRPPAESISCQRISSRH
ncbi:hypothetical protein GJW-30_1_00478 [Variibacter gotjawalensis]|uniref:Uncharacterized protein n=1 Tax=Variibacter gotjawalensis TaxID=1333996 RepID=A0A0S3PQB7_9BRAD|nr:hypothetical protein [Variibacter gotjawalensis]NIK48264.1 invasion protein IalB [Variibacter gotjawalensis]RZS50136.1 hypothetical protein EV661_2588 [Variibacter gotjawalensis]BAT57966.1 hypothetical protein GJW-30_1_00478 [Variibacter gotjawalensis]